MVMLASFNAYSSTPSIYDECIRILQNYLAIDTTNPPGNEMETAKFLKKILDKEGIENHIFDLGSNRANLYAVIKGDGSQKSLIMLHHMDVVSADPKYWKHPPFGSQIADGYIYARGAVDIKSKGIIDLMTMINIKRNKIALKGDLVFLAVADEEAGSTGTKWMIKNKPEIFKNAEYIIDEGASVLLNEKGEVNYYSIAMGEKSPLWLTLKFTGRPGHGSLPIRDSSVNRALRAANRILDYNAEFIVLPELKDELELIFSSKDITKISGFNKDLPTSLKNKTFLEESSKDPQVNALLRNTISITRLKGSEKINSIPNEASISLDCRLIPGVDKDKFIESLKRIINDDTVIIETEDYANTLYSPTDTAFVNALKKCAAKRNPDKKVIPVLLISSTDSSFYRAIGIKAYGFEAYKLTQEDWDRAHGNDERMGVDNIKFAIDLMTDILIELNK